MGKLIKNKTLLELNNFRELSDLLMIFVRLKGKQLNSPQKGTKVRMPGEYKSQEHGNRTCLSYA